MNEYTVWILGVLALGTLIASFFKKIGSGYQSIARWVSFCLMTLIGLDYVIKNVSIRDITTWQMFLSLLLLQFGLTLWTYLDKKYIAPIRITLITITTYGLLAQLTLLWSSYLFTLGGFTQVLNVIYLGVFSWLLLQSPAGELKGGEIGRLEFGGVPFWLDIVISQGKAILPLMFGYEVMERRLAYSMAKSVQIGKGAKGTVGVRIWFKIARPSTLSEYDVETQVKPEITRLFQSDIIAWARTVDDDTFINSLKIIEKKVEDGLKNGQDVLNRFGLQVESIACADPEQSKGTDEAQAVIDMMNKLTNGGIEKTVATNMAMAMSGHAELVLMGLGGKGGRNSRNGALIVDDDTEKKGGKKGESTDKKEEKKKLSDGPKAKGTGALKMVTIIWVTHIVIALLGWGKNQKTPTTGVTAEEVSDAIVVTAEKLNPNNLLPKRLNQPTLDIPLVDNCKGEWIMSTGVDKYGNRISDDEGWIRNDQPGYLRAHIKKLEFDKKAPSNELLIEAELESGEIQTFSSDKNGDWFIHVGDAKRPVYYLTLLEKCKRLRFKVLDPHPEYPLSFIIRRSK